MTTFRSKIGWIALTAMLLLQGGVPAANQSGLDRLVAARRAVDEVYWRHTIWPSANRAPKPSLQAVLPEAVIRAQATDGLRKSAALEKLWGRAITADQIQAEMDRMAADTKSPDMLRELFAALDNDPNLVAEALARPHLADRLIRTAYDRDERYHGPLRQRLEETLLRSASLSDLVRAGGEPSEVVYVRGEDAAALGGGSSSLGDGPA